MELIGQGGTQPSGELPKVRLSILRWADILNHNHSYGFRAVELQTNMQMCGETHDTRHVDI